MRRFAFGAALAVAVTALAPQAADASVVITSISDNPGFLTGNLSYSPTSLVLGGVGISRFELKGTNQPGGAPADYLTYCIDIFHTLHNGSFEIAPVSTLIADAGRQAQLLTLLSNTDPLIAAAATQADKMLISSATQMAVWEIAFEGAGNPYAVGAGDLQISGGNSGAARTLANTYLSNITGNVWTPVAGKQVSLLYSRDNQSQIFLAGVPEPATWAMLIGGFGLVGATARRRRRTTIAFA
jgi:hypothetical protein